MSRIRSNQLGKTEFTSDSKTKQSEGPQTDINTIVNRYLRSGELNHFNGRVPRYGDFSAMNDLQDQLNAVHEATDRFMALPATIRDAAGHDPVKFLEMLATEDGTELLIAAGLDVEIDREGEPEPSPSKPSPKGDPTERSEVVSPSSETDPS